MSKNIDELTKQNQIASQASTLDDEHENKVEFLKQYLENFEDILNEADALLFYPVMVE